MLKLSFRLQVLTGFAISVLLVLLVGTLAYRSINKLESDTVAVEHTQKVIKTSTDLLQELVNAETGMRGYVASNDKVFLDPYNAALPGITADLQQLRTLTEQSAQQTKRVDSLQHFASTQLNILKENIDARPVKGLDYMVQNHMLARGKASMDEIRLLTGHLTDSENALLAARKAITQQSSEQAMYVIVGGSVVFLVIIIVMFFYIQATFDRQKEIEQEITVANTELEKAVAENTAKNWLLTGIAQLNEKMQGEQNEKNLSENILTEICSYTKALAGTFYLYNEHTGQLDFCSAYAFANPAEIKRTIGLDEGWVGQAIKNKKAAIIQGRINERLDLGSSVILQPLTESILVPIFFDKKLKGFMEIAFNGPIAKSREAYIINVANSVGITINTAQSRTIMQELLAQVQQQTEELEAQQEEMRVTNDELLAKTELLQESEEELRSQQEELRTINAELEEKANLLEEKNHVIEEARSAIGLKVRELETTGKYRSEFLANMSHELRTPLNSILVLAQVLKENRPANLSADQVKYANVIFNAGNDLLTLINDILDLSKIESGKVDVQNEPVRVAEILADMEMLFAEIAANKAIKFEINTGSNAPEQIVTDKVRIGQVLKNLLSNAFKFTPEKGLVSVTAVKGDEEGTINFRIKDSGIGIPEDKQKIIFEAFQQADGSTSRRYGGTGLGLSISRELVAMLGGKITLTSKPGKGSEFVLTIPVKPATGHISEKADNLPQTMAAALTELVVPESAVAGKQPFVIIVEDDKNFADILSGYAQERGFEAMVINEGTHAVDIIQKEKPDAIILDIMLPGKDGWQILKELKHDKATMHIPVHLMSAGEAATNRVRQEGAMGFLKKPVDKGALDKLFNDIIPLDGKKHKHILLIEDSKAENSAMTELAKNKNLVVMRANDGKSALRMLNEKQYDGVVLDLSLPDIPGLDLLDQIKGNEKFSTLPVIINTAMELDKDTVRRLMQYANAMVVKTNKSAERLMDEVNLFLNKITDSALLQNASLAAGENMLRTESSNFLKGKRILIVDDDLRNIFALSNALQGYGITVEIAADGQEALHKLEKIKGIDLVLMDIMMPVMDGYEAMRAIRAQQKWAGLPIIALTAKAMSGDREKCIRAGANDYVAKPVDINRLISLLRIWLER